MNMNYDWNTEAEWMALTGEEHNWVTGKASKASIMGKFNCAFEAFEKRQIQQGWDTLVLANGGSMIAQLHVGCAYLFGWITMKDGEKINPVDKDMKMAIKYLYKAAKQGDKGALENLKEIRKNTPFDDIKTYDPGEWDGKAVDFR